jgi:hypothetical protein
LRKGRTLSVILSDLRPDRSLSEEIVVEAARKFHELFGRWPTSDSTEPVPGVPETSWISIDKAARRGTRGFKRGRSLAKILASVKDDRTLSESKIIKAAKDFHKLHKVWPTSDSTEPVPGMENETWKAIGAAGQVGRRGLKKGRTISQIIGHLKDDNTLTEAKIIESAKNYFKSTGKWPSSKNKDLAPGIPNTIWKNIDASGYAGTRGLKKGRTLAVILATVKRAPQK